MQAIHESNLSSDCSVNEEEHSLFQHYIEEISGITIPPEKAYLFETRLTKLMLDYGTESFCEFYQYIKNHPSKSLQQKIIDSITTNETLWFRDVLPWTVLEQIYLPRYIHDLRSGAKTRIRIWSAASSTGQEIYSIVMCIQKYLVDHRITDIQLSHFEFLATDISNRVLEIAKEGRYDQISMSRGLPEEYKSQFFTEQNNSWEIDPSIKKAVRFRQSNLIHDFQAFGSFDVIFCRYVLIYFNDQIKRELMMKFIRSLKVEGIFFTGSYTLYNMMCDYLTAKHYQNLTYYIKEGEQRE